MAVKQRTTTKARARTVTKTTRRGRRISTGSGIRCREPTPAQVAFANQRRAESRALEARIEANTCGLGHWRQPEGWDRTPYTHTVTTVDGVNAGHPWGSGWNIYNSGVVVALVVHDPVNEAYTRGHPYVWCKPTRNGNGDNARGPFPTACVFGRFIEKDRQGRPIALIGEGEQQTIEASHSMCFRAVGHVYQGSEFYPRSEVPVPIPDEAVRRVGPMRFDWLQAAIKHVTDALDAMAVVTNMVDEMNDAATGNDGDKFLNRRCNQSDAYTALDQILSTAMSKQSRVRDSLDEFLKASPELAFWLKRWQATQATPAERV